MIKNLIIFFLLTTLSYSASEDYNATQNAYDLGLYYQDYNFLMSLSGLFSGLLLASITLLLITKLGK